MLHSMPVELHSMPVELIGARMLARAAVIAVKLYYRGHLLEVHPRQEPGRRHTDPADCPARSAPTRFETSTSWPARHSAEQAALACTARGRSR
jgi:hypothetical protein